MEPRALTPQKKIVSISALLSHQPAFEIEELSTIALLPGRDILAETIRTLMAPRKFIKLDVVPRLVRPETKLGQDWVTIGVLVHKGPIRVSKLGQSYMCMTLGDLEGKEIKVLVFSEAFEKWKDEARGNVLGMLNARGLGGAEGSYAVDRAGQVFKIGKAKDFDICRGLDGKRCENYVNSKYTKQCPTHFRVKPKSLVRRLELSVNMLPVKRNLKQMPDHVSSEHLPPRPEEVSALESYLKHRSVLAQDSRAPVTIEIDWSNKRKREHSPTVNKKPKLV